MSQRSASPSSLLLPLVAGCIALAAMADPAGAAVRVCRQPVESEPMTAKTEQGARALALLGWSAAAKRFGDRFTSWRLANGKSLSCTPVEGGVRCVARGSPCTIQQRPPQTPPGILKRSTTIDA